MSLPPELPPELDKLLRLLQQSPETSCRDRWSLRGARAALWVGRTLARLRGALRGLWRLARGRRG